MRIIIVVMVATILSILVFKYIDHSIGADLLFHEIRYPETTIDG